MFEFNVGSAELTQNYNVSSTLVGNETTDGPDFLETFETVNFNVAGSYGDYSFEGTTGVTWSTIASRDDAGYPITGDNAVMLRRVSDNSSITSSTITGGISSFSVKTRKGFTGSGNRQVELWIGSDASSLVSYGKSEAYDVNDEIRTFSVSNINFVGDFVIRITNPNSGQIVIDDIGWSSFSNGEVEISGTTGYRMLSAPVAGFTVSDISDNTAIQGVTGGVNTGFTSNFYYFGSTGQWAVPTDVNTAFGDGYGFIVKFFNNALNGSSELPITLDVSGSEPSSDVVVSLNKTINVSDEESTVYYTLVGNPFASNLDLSSLSVNNGGSVSANAIIWDNATSDYATVSTSTGVLAPWQGFWTFVLQADDATELTIPTSGKTSTAATSSHFKQAAAPIEGLFSLTHGEVTSQPFKVFLHENAKLGFDIYDVSKFTPLSDAYAVIGGRQLSNSSLKAIESLPMNLNEVVELAIEPQIVGNSGEFTINWKQFSQFPEAFTIELHDSQTGETYDLRNDGMVTFTIDALPKAASKSDDLVLSGGSDRFKVVITPITTSVESGNTLPTSVELSQNFPNPFNPSTTIQYAVPAQSTVRLAVYDMLGREVAVLVNGTKAAGNYEFTFDASALSSGMYMYRLEAAGTVMTRKMTLIK